MAYDLIRKREDGKDWSMSSGDWATSAVVERIKKNVPKEAVIGTGIGLGVALLYVLWPKKALTAGGVPRKARWDEPTKEIHHQSMHETVYGRKAS